MKIIKAKDIEQDDEWMQEDVWDEIYNAESEEQMSMQIVINIDKEDYEKIRETSFVENTEIMFKQSSEDRKGTMMLFRVIDAIKNGTPLPKGHGDLIDRKEIDWISIDEKVPINGQRVLVCFNDGFILIGAYINYAEDGKEPYWVFDGEEDFNLEDAQVIAWMPLPESHKAESEVEECFVKNVEEEPS